MNVPDRIDLQKTMAVRGSETIWRHFHFSQSAWPSLLPFKALAQRTSASIFFADHVTAARNAQPQTLI